ncbi:RAS1 protein [Vermiconidia calcicola]|uniref:RAS1 protein n=1 Tax=Vermiconidia calcicola TaxID=1690605 RepID=A0ACC3NGK5_9PEZI|nr:RAS1 protein [Vermiconidia calcicola]
MSSLDAVLPANWPHTETCGDSRIADENIARLQKNLGGVSLETRAERMKRTKTGTSSYAPLPRHPSPEQIYAVSEYLKGYKFVDNAKGQHARYIQISAIMLGQGGVEQVQLTSDGFFEGYDPSCDDCFRATTYIDGKYVMLEGITMYPHLEWSAETQGWLCDSHALFYSYARHCETIIFVYDVTSRKSFETMRTHYNNICLDRSRTRSQYTAKYCHGTCPARVSFQGLYFVIANKIDCDKAKWEVPLEDGEQFCSSAAATCIFMPMSCKTGEGSSKNAFRDMATHILFRRIQNTAPPREDEARDSDSLPKGGGSRLSRFWSTFTKRRSHNGSQPETSEVSMEKKLAAAINQSWELRNPNELYRY